MNVEPFAEAWDREEQIPRTVISLLGEAGHLGVTMPREYGGQGWNTVTFGLLNEAVGRGSSALTDVITCQAMVSMALLKWGTPEQKDRWIPSLAKGETIGAFALTEPGAGSDTQALATEFTPTSNDGELILNGHKKWISCAQFADIFLVFGMLDQRSVACLVATGDSWFQHRTHPRVDGVPRGRPRRASLRKCPGARREHRRQTWLRPLACRAVGLHYGRISTACSGAGLLRGCFEESVAYAATRAIGAQTVGDLGMIRSLITRMGTDSEAARLLCVSACRAEDDGRPDAFEKTLMAKYFTSRAAVRAASDAVQIRGASGCHGSSPVSRFYRDAKILEIIEGTTQIHEQILGKMLVDRGRADAERSDERVSFDACDDRSRSRRIATFNATEAPFPDHVTLHGLIEAQVERHASANRGHLRPRRCAGNAGADVRATQRASQPTRALFAGRGCRAGTHRRNHGGTIVCHDGRSPRDSESRRRVPAARTGHSARSPRLHVEGRRRHSAARPQQDREERHV